MMESRVNRGRFRPMFVSSVVIATAFTVVVTAQLGVPGAVAAESRPAPMLCGMNGHRIIAAIAERHLLPVTRLRIAELIGPYPLAYVANWADWYRATPEGRHTSSWHYVNIPLGEEYVEPESDTPQDLIQAMRLQERILADTARSVEERATALKLLVHFIGDAHQPLHAGYASDRGGNGIPVRWFGRPTNLHSVWDYLLLEHQSLSYTEYVEFLDFASPEEIVAWNDSRDLDWIGESRALLDQLYAPVREAAADSTTDLGWDYVNALTPPMERRLLMAGVRLAGVLNRILGA